MRLVFYMTVFSCATTPQTGGLLSLDGAIAASAEQLGTDLAGRKVAVVAFGSGSEALSEYVMEELSRMLVNSRALTVVDRRELDLVREELRFQLSGEVSDESARSIGKMLGAEAVVSGSITDLGSVYRFSAKAIDVESAVVPSAPAFDIARRDSRTAYLLGGAAVRRESATVQPAGLPQTGQRILPRDLAEVFGVSGVTASFNAVHSFLQTCNGESGEARRERIAQRILLGDWIDLPHLTVQGDAGGGAVDTDNTDLGGNGKLLRLIVVGIDSFAKTNRDAPAHVVFQFQNIPGEHHMNSYDTNAGGYKASDMRRYLTGSFLRGLVAAGLPEGVLYAPVRSIANGGGDRANAADGLADWLWLPTEWEIRGENVYSNERYETAANQARLEYYDSNLIKKKYDADSAYWWWLASSGSAATFASVYGHGYADHLIASTVGGCAPAFCVR
jgi:TolB-like protein